jgi:hypothetical protein
MKWLMRLLLGGRRPTPEAQAARVEAAESLAQAAQDRAEAVAHRAEAERITAQLRQHNAANRYDEWLREVLSR